VAGKLLDPAPGAREPYRLLGGPGLVMFVWAGGELRVSGKASSLWPWRLIISSSAVRALLLLSLYGERLLYFVDACQTDSRGFDYQ